MLYHIMLLFSKISNMLLKKCACGGWGGGIQGSFFYVSIFKWGKKILLREKSGAGGGGGGTGLPRSFPSMLRASSNNILMKIRHVNLCFSPRRFAFFLVVGFPQNRDGVINLSIEKYKRLKLKVAIYVNENHTRTIRGFIAI